jgi:hypothetical protein
MNSETKHIPRGYLKYYRVIRYFFCAKYNLSYPELEMLFFLEDEKYFSRQDFNDYNELFSWDKKRFEKLRQEEWISTFRKPYKKIKAMYMVSQKGKRLIDSFYKKLAGEEIPVSESGNPLFRRNVSYTDKVYRNMIIEMNDFIKQQRHLSQE